MVEVAVSETMDDVAAPWILRFLARVLDVIIVYLISLVAAVVPCDTVAASGVPPIRPSRRPASIAPLAVALSPRE